MRLAEAYADGTSWLFGADLAAIVARAGSRNPALEPLGLKEARHLIVERTESGHEAHTEAVITFEGIRHGVASWLAEPGPMGGLDYVSPDATAAASVVLRDPGDAVRELLEWFEGADPKFREALEQVRQGTGVDPVADLAEPLGGNLTVALDGPVLPVPAWKVVVEVYDPARLQRTAARIVQRANDELRKQGREPLVTLLEDSAGGRVWSTIRIAGSPMEIHWTYDQGWLVAGPSRALVERAIDARAAGISLVRSPRFRDVLPVSSRTSFSALVYDDAGRAFGELAGAARVVTGQDPAGAASLPTDRPRLAYAWAEPDRITLASDGEGGIGAELVSLISLSSHAGPGGFLRGRLGSAGVEAPEGPGER